MSIRGDDMFPLFQIVEQSGFYFLSEVDDCLIPTFSPDLDATVIEIHIVNIQSHKLRSTYGTELYKETGDIYLVADVLGHKDVNTTRKHYAALEEQRRKQAANAFHLREHSDRHSEHPDN